MGTGHWDMNMSWIYESFTEDFHMEIEFKDVVLGGKMEAEYTRKCFEEEMERAVNRWIRFKAFQCGDPAIFSIYDSIWDYIHDAAIDYQKTNPHHMDFHYTEAQEDCSKCKKEVTEIWSDGLCDDCHE